MNLIAESITMGGRRQNNYVAVPYSLILRPAYGGGMLRELYETLCHQKEDGEAKVFSDTLTVFDTACSNGLILIGGLKIAGIRHDGLGIRAFTVDDVEKFRGEIEMATGRRLETRPTDVRDHYADYEFIEEENDKDTLRRTTEI